LTTPTEYIYQDVKGLLDPLNTRQKIEVLANLFVDIGVSNMANSQVPTNITKEKVVEIILDDVNISGDTLANALARQGLILLTWLDKEE
tara:strand:- start:242 stop:508 length:267 start_codon:yes stop_codon:yes gene_type:complete